MIKQLIVAKTYKPFDETSVGVYVSVAPKPRTLATLSDIGLTLGLPLSDAEKEELHCTVVYSKVIPKYLPQLDPSVVYKARILGLEWWSGHDAAGYIVLKMDSPGLTQLNKQWLDAGCVSSFPDYQAHVTIKKDVGAMPDDFYLKRKRIYRDIGATLEFHKAHLEGLKAKP